MNKYAKDFFGEDFRIALGIRYDEFRRVKLREDAIYPLATVAKITKAEILEWWQQQPFGSVKLKNIMATVLGAIKT